jgi:hypothetical protein
VVEDAGVDTAPDAEPDSRVGTDAQAIAEVRTTNPADSNAAVPDSRRTQDTQSIGLADTATATPPASDALALADAQVAVGGDTDAQSDDMAKMADALTVMDAPAADSFMAIGDARMGDGTKDSAGSDATSDTLAAVQPDARSVDGRSSDSAGSASTGKTSESGCKCNLSGRGGRPSDLALLALGLVALALRRRSSGRRR